MKGLTRNYFPGGNTPAGFHSYYNYILPQRKAKKIFCIKGGPGVGKSTLMKDIAKYFTDKGEQVELLWCSSDPDSLDGVVIKNRSVALVDGTAPHIVDPITPGAIDEIINLGDCWDETGIIPHKNSIMDCSEKISENFNLAYVYLRSAKEQYDAMTNILSRAMEREIIPKFLRDIFMQSAISPLPEANGRRGYEKRAFASAITPYGLKNHLNSLHKDVRNVLVIETPVGFPSEQILGPVSEELSNRGFNVEKYYCPMEPEKRIEHIVSQDADMAFITCNKYHGSSDIEISEGKYLKTVSLNVLMLDKESRKTYESLLKDSGKNIDKAMAYLKKAKYLHDELEQYYIPNMTFEKISLIKHSIIGKIDSCVLY